ncbi:prohibitin family protein [Candidatus Peregrinibacteria bacterium]|nr:prohibitin family protein [Candidatus Peregrinibacteria bacterium]
MPQFPPIPRFPQFQMKGKNLIGIAIAIVVFLIILDGLVSVPPGHVGIIYDRGRGVLAKELPEGLHLKIPFWQVSYLMDVRTQEYTMSVSPGEGAIYSDDSMTAPTADGQTVKVDATVLFHVDRDKAAELFQSVGPDYIQKIVRTISRSQIRAVIANYSAIDVYAKKRAEAEVKINEVIKKLFAEKDIILESVLLRHIAFSPEYASAIEEKQVAEQKIQKAEFQRLEAEKLKEKKIIEAEADAEAIRLKGETLRANPQVIQYEFVQKMAPDINWGVLPDDILPMLNLGSR